MPYLTRPDGIDVYYEDFGDGPALLFIHAGNLSHAMWEGQVAALAGEFRTVTFDWRGTGQSGKPRRGYTVEAVVDDVRALIDELRLEDTTLVGHGIGTHVALMLAQTRPEAVRGLALASAAPWFSGERDGAVGGLSQEFIHFLEQKNGLGTGRGAPYAQACAELAEHWLFHRQPHPAVFQALLAQALGWPQFVINSYATTMRSIDHRDRLPRISCPTLLLQGRHDRKQRYEGAAYMANLLPNARLVTLEQSAHMGQTEEEHTFNEALRGFVRSLPKGARSS
jgi:pimeloyl-ACP methyl ester carboxylesterase